MKRWSAMLVCLGLFAAACSSGGGGSGGSGVTPAQCTAGGLTVASGSVSPGPSGEAPVTLNVWSFYTGREFKQYCSVLQDFHKKYPWITSPAHGGEDRPGHRASGQLRHGARHDRSAPDPTTLRSSAPAGPTGPEPVHQGGRHRPVHDRPRSRHRGTRATTGCSARCPMLSDAYGLYYNTAMFKKAGITEPAEDLLGAGDRRQEAHRLQPRRVDQGGRVHAAARASTRARSYHNGNCTAAAQWYDDRGKSAFASDPSWAALLQWQKEFITNVYGADGYQAAAVLREARRPGLRVSTAQGFETGKLAMAFDGEWRIAFIADDSAKVKYATAPFPVADEQPRSATGRGRSAATSSGSRRTRRTRTTAWLLVKYLALDTQAEVKLATILKNVPTTFESLKDPTLTADPHFKVFLRDLREPELPLQADHAASGHRRDPLAATSSTKWEAGQVPDLQRRAAGGRDTDRQAVATRVSRGSDGDGPPSSLELSPARRKARRRTPARRRYVSGARCSCRRGSSGSSCFYVYPMLASLYLLVHAVRPASSQPSGSGLTNYRFMFTQDPLFWQSLRNTIWIVIVGVAAPDRLRDRHAPWS